jgi:dihydropteroate synthase
MFLCGRFRLDLARPLIMGIINVTPDSFSDGGRFLDSAAAIEHGLRLKEEGADMLDIGGESTRPGAQPVPAEEELRRVLPVLEGLTSCGLPLSVDTGKPQVMREAIRCGADMINDVRALRAEGGVETLASSAVGICLMHMQGTPVAMQLAPEYADVVEEVKAFLRDRIEALVAAGIARQRIVIDPGFGFGKTVAHNLQLLRRLADLLGLGVPVLVGLSRKSMLGAITGRPEADRLAASLTAAILAVQRGARIVRVHDVKATRDALAVLQAVEKGEAT